MELNPSWHAEDSPWKAEQIMRMLNRHPLELRSIAEVGCGVGGILVALHESFPPQTIEFHGFDIASEAITRAKEKQKDHLHFYATDIFKDGRHFDLLLVMDVIEHVPDYLGFLESCQQNVEDADYLGSACHGTVCFLWCRFDFFLRYHTWCARRIAMGC